jgi:cytochrome P450
VVLVSPLLLGQDPAHVPRGTADPEVFDPARWSGSDARPGGWLPFGAGPHACPGRSLGLAQLVALARWGAGRRIQVVEPVAIDQTRGIFPRPARVTCEPIPLPQE